MGRILWLLNALIGIAYSVYVALSWKLRDIDMSCSKIGEHDTGQFCDSSLISAYGIWPLLLLGIALSVPALIAAGSRRTRTSWLAVTWLTIMFLVGIGLWTSLFSLLLFAAPLVLLGLVATAFIQHENKKNPNSTA